MTCRWKLSIVPPKRITQVPLLWNCCLVTCPQITIFVLCNGRLPHMSHLSEQPAASIHLTQFFLAQDLTHVFGRYSVTPAVLKPIFFH